MPGGEASHTMAANTEILAQVPLFSILDQQELAALAERVDHEKAAAGTVLFRQGEPGEALYVVVRGRVEICVQRHDGQRVVVETAEAGEFFGEISLLDAGPRTATATCSEETEMLVVDRGDLDHLFRLKPAAAMDLLAATGKRLRETSRLLRQSAAKDINEETEDKRSVIERAADWVTEFSGSIPFLVIHLILFTVWIVWNLEAFSSIPGAGFDPFPYGLLTMCVSLEAIILSVLVMLSQNRQVARDRIRNDIEYQVNVSAEAKVAALHEKVDRLHEEMMKRMATMEKRSAA